MLNVLSIYIFQLFSKQIYEDNSVSVFIIQMKKMRLREVKQLLKVTIAQASRVEI